MFPLPPAQTLKKREKNCMAWGGGTIQERLQGIRTETNTAQGTYTKNLAESIYAYKTADKRLSL